MTDLRQTFQDNQDSPTKKNSFHLISKKRQSEKITVASKNYPFFPRCNNSVINEKEIELDPKLEKLNIKTNRPILWLHEFVSFYNFLAFHSFWFRHR